MKIYKYILVLLTLLVASPSLAQSLENQWRNGLRGAKLTAYKGSVISNNSTLTVLHLCYSGRYVYYREGSWSAPGAALGSNRGRITGQWNVRQRGYRVFLVYRTDRGQTGAFPMYLQRNGRVNIGGLAYAVQRGAAGC